MKIIILLLKTLGIIVELVSKLTKNNLKIYQEDYITKSLKFLKTISNFLVSVAKE